MVDASLEKDALELRYALLFDEFIVREYKKGNILRDSFSTVKKHIKLHGHCHQKVLVSILPSKEILSLPENFEVEVIPSGCCGMIGAFGYSKKNYNFSMAIGE